MNQFVNVAKGGWHPPKKGNSYDNAGHGGEGGGVRGRVSGLMGRAGGQTRREEALEHQSAPLSTLRDPTAFGPPPKHSQYHGVAAATTSSPSTAGPGTLGTQDPGGLGGTVPPEKLRLQQERARLAEEEANRPAAPVPAVPYRVNTTGIDASNLPKPPSRRPGTDGTDASPSPTRPSAARPPPPMPSQPPFTRPAPPAPSPRTATRPPPPPPSGKPALPPRLPPRQTSRPDLYTPDPPPAYDDVVPLAQQPRSPPPPPRPARDGQLNQGALDRLSQAGLSVPGLNIGSDAAPAMPPRPTATSPSLASPALATGPPQVGELQARFARLGAGGGSPVGDVAGGVRRKAPPPPVPEGLGGSGAGSGGMAETAASPPPPVPLGSKPRPGGG